MIGGNFGPLGERVARSACAMDHTGGMNGSTFQHSAMNGTIANGAAQGMFSAEDLARAQAILQAQALLGGGSIGGSLNGCNHSPMSYGCRDHWQCDQFASAGEAKIV
jgi:hypothetical protein